MSLNHSVNTFDYENGKYSYAKRYSTASVQSESLFSPTSLQVIMSSTDDKNHNRAHDGRILALKVVGKINLRIERKSYDELTKIINQLPGEVLTLILNRVDIEALHNDIPNSLSILSALYMKIYTDCSSNGFSIKNLNCEDVIQHLVKYFTELLKFNDQTYCSAHSKEFMRNILFVCARVDTGLYGRLKDRVKMLSRVLDGFSQHTLVKMDSRSSATYCMRLHEALKIEIENTLTHYKASIQKLSEVFQNIPQAHKTFEEVAAGCNAKQKPDEKHFEKIKEMTQQHIEDRLFFNQSVLNAVEPKTRNSASVSDLIAKLERRVQSDKEVLQLLAQLRKAFVITKDEEKVFPLFERYHKTYVLLVQLLDEGTTRKETVSQLKPQAFLSKPSTTSSANKWSDVGDSDTDGFDTVTQLDDTEMSASSSYDSSESPRTQPESDSTVMEKVHPVTSIPNTSAPPQLNLLQRQLEAKEKELKMAQRQVARLSEREKELSCRLADQAERQLRKSGKYEDLSEGECRPTALVDRYDNLFTQTRLDALDGLEELDAFNRLEDGDDIKAKLLFSVVVVAFRTVQHTLSEKQHKMKKLLGLGDSEQGHDVVDQMATYLRQTAHRFNLDTVNKDVGGQLWSTLYDFPELKQSLPLQTYIEECVRVAWMASVQVPPMTLEYEAMDYQTKVHTRLHTSNTDNTQIQYYIWPALIDSRTRDVLYKATVIT